MIRRWHRCRTDAASRTADSGRKRCTAAGSGTRDITPGRSGPADAQTRDHRSHPDRERFRAVASRAADGSSRRTIVPTHRAAPQSSDTVCRRRLRRESAQGALARQQLPPIPTGTILTRGIGPPHQHRQKRIMPQIIVIVEVFIPRCCVTPKNWGCCRSHVRQNVGKMLDLPHALASVATPRSSYDTALAAC